jgi:hypothetical protein
MDGDMYRRTVTGGCSDTSTAPTMVTPTVTIAAFLQRHPHAVKEQEQKQEPPQEQHYGPLTA